MKPEILAPAGDLEKLKIAVIYGADAVYLGGKELSLRAAAGNFTFDEMKEGVEFAHSKGKKVYCTLNIFPHNRDIKKIQEEVIKLKEIKADALIVSDPGVINITKDIVPEISLHLSTQSNVTNWASVMFWKKQGISRVNLARELSINEISEIASNVTGMELEAFVHGAMCISYSGRCLLSNYMTGRGSNQGECSHPCRYKYFLMEEKRPGEYYKIEEDDRGSYIFNSKDLSMLPYLKELMNAGVTSFKIEGRMKSVHYVATVVKAYREVLDGILNGKDVLDKWLSEIKKVSHREYTTGFYFGQPDVNDHNYYSSSYTRNYDFVGIVKGYCRNKKLYKLEQRNNFKKGDTVEIFTPSGEVLTYKIDYMQDIYGKEIIAAPHPQQIIYMQIDKDVKPYSMIRRSVQ